MTIPVHRLHLDPICFCRSRCPSHRSPARQRHRTKPRHLRRRRERLRRALMRRRGTWRWVRGHRRQLMRIVSCRGDEKRTTLRGVERAILGVMHDGQIWFPKKKFRVVILQVCLGMRGRTIYDWFCEHEYASWLRVCSKSSCIFTSSPMHI